MKKFLVFLVIPLLLFGHTPEEKLLSMTLEEKVGELFAAPVLFNGIDKEKIFRFIENYHVGGLLLKKGSFKEHRDFLSELKIRLNRRLLTMKDAEWGVPMQMTEGQSFPRNAELGQAPDEQLVFSIGKKISLDCKKAGVDLNLSPVLDVHTNKENPVLKTRSFGSESEVVARLGRAMIGGLQSSGTLACAKHFPGHGDTEVDSHLALPVIQSFDINPFNTAIGSGVAFMMIGHLVCLELDPSGVPCTFSHKVVTEYLKNTLGFKGLVITDALNMKAISDNFSSQEAAILAFKAGCHILLYGSHLIEDVEFLMEKTIPDAYQALVEAFVSGDLNIQELDERVLAILKLKENLPSNYFII